MGALPPLMTAREAAAWLGISLNTLWRIEKQGLLTPFRTPGGHRRYSILMLQEYLEETRESWVHRSGSSDEPDAGEA
jgi:excisionase family DNA binding protein